MITQERKSKFKHKITITRKQEWGIPKIEPEMRQWCEDNYGPSGRRNRWRYGWTDDQATFYFRQPKDAMMFTLRWAT